MATISITAETREDALREALQRLKLPEEALDIEWTKEEEELLAGARPYVQMNVSINFDYVADKVKTCLEGLLEKMQIEGTVVTSTDDNMIIASIDSNQSDILIGYHGETLDALQHLVVRMARLGGRDMPLILVDAGKYRYTRLERLKKVALILADMVLENGGEEDFDPMHALDRKIIHTILKNVEGIQTYSRGEGYSRKVIVAVKE